MNMRMPHNVRKRWMMKESKFQFLAPYLTQVHFELNPEFDPEDKSCEIKMQNDFSVHIKKGKEENRANVELVLEINMDNENAPFKMKIGVASDFRWDDLPEKAVESMLNINAPALLLGYMRPAVANITNSSNLPVYNLPFINFKEQ